MTEYWKTQERKYCDFCKCWLAGNKISISYHENGKKHKENVQKHISQLSKKSAKDYKEKSKIDEEMKQMEAAALAAYANDVRNNADITSQSINEMLGHSTERVPDAPQPASVDKPAPEWHEVKSENGSYYWNTITNETTWDPPDDYLSLAQQAEIELKEDEKVKNDKKREKIQKLESTKSKRKETQAHLNRESMRSLAAKEDPKPSVDYGPSPRPQPYGGWQTVVHEPEEKIDFQAVQTIPKAAPPIIMEPEIKFKEKRIESLGEGPVEFKKRKFNNAKRNARQKIDDD